MNLSEYYWWFQKVIPQHICDDILKYGLAQKKQIASTFKYHRDLSKAPLTKGEYKDLKKTRDSHIVWMNDPWIYKEIHPYVHEANRNAGWNFQWDFTEACQFTTYTKGQHYTWHCDDSSLPYNKPHWPNYHKKRRKLSMTLLLSDSKNFKGGELEFDFRNSDGKEPTIKKCTEVSEKGSLVVFPSFVWHRVRPVTQGTRHSLVVWNLGWPYQ